MCDDDQYSLFSRNPFQQLQFLPPSSPAKVDGAGDLSVPSHSTDALWDSMLYAPQPISAAAYESTQSTSVAAAESTQSTSADVCESPRDPPVSILPTLADVAAKRAAAKITTSTMSANLVAAKLSAAKPTSVKPASAKPTSVKPASAKPASAKPVSAKPASAKPASAKPASAKTATAKTCTVAKSAVTKPISSATERDVSEIRREGAVMLRILKQVSTGSVRHVYGVDIVLDPTFVSTLATIQSPAYAYHASRRRHKDSMQANYMHAIRNKYVSPTTGEPCPPNNRHEGVVLYPTLEAHVDANGGTIEEHAFIIDNRGEHVYVDDSGYAPIGKVNGQEYVTIRCAEGHTWTSPIAVAMMGWCAICEYNEAYAKMTDPDTHPPICDVDSYAVNYESRITLPFTCHKGHKFSASVVELQHGECTVCMLEKTYAAHSIYINIIGGAYTHPDSLLRAKCRDCGSEFYLTPSDRPSRCQYRHRPVSYRNAFLSMVVRVLETVYNCRFDDPSPYQWEWYDAFSAKMGMCVTIDGNEYVCAKHKLSEDRLASIIANHGFVHVHLTRMAATDRETVFDVIQALGTQIEPFSKFTNDTKVQLVDNVLELMTGLANANRDFPARRAHLHQS